MISIARNSGPPSRIAGITYDVGCAGRNVDGGGRPAGGRFERRRLPDGNADGRADGAIGRCETKGGGGVTPCGIGIGDEPGGGIDITCGGAGE